MTYEEAITWLKYDMSMVEVDPMTGEKANLCEEHRKVLEAQTIAIKVLEDRIVMEKISEKMRELINRGVNNDN